MLNVRSCTDDCTSICVDNCESGDAAEICSGDNGRQKRLDTGSCEFHDTFIVFSALVTVFKLLKLLTHSFAIRKTFTIATAVTAASIVFVKSIIVLVFAAVGTLIHCALFVLVTCGVVVPD